MSVYRNTNCFFVFLTVVLLVLLSAACGKTTSEVMSTQTPFEEVTSISGTSDLPESTSTVEPTQTQEPQYKILFVGNSFTYWNNGIDFHITQLAYSADPPLIIQADAVAMSGATLEIMWEESEAREIISEGDYDVIVLQGALGLRVVDTFDDHTRMFVAEIRKAGAEPVMFMQWPIVNLTLEESAKRYGDIARELDIDVAPVGFAWQQALDEHPETILTILDNIHPSIHGSYLAANVIYATVFGESSRSNLYTI